MSGETLLTDLCAICHVNAIKYTCPRCGIHTCSLACVKKHKAWAQCSGVRNPAEYRKRAELATPSSVDKDFNFITNVERSITQADDNVLERGINLAPARRLRPNDARPKVEVEIEARDIKVMRAPKGLSRAKQNKTHWVNQQKSIMWTIEWVCPDGEKIVGSSIESRTLSEAYISTVGKKKLKRKRRYSQQDSASVIRATKVTKQEPVLPTQQPIDTKEAETQHGSTRPSTQDDALLTEMHFHLHDPTTPSKVRCLVPCSADQTVRDVLQSQTVLEFPTIYVLSHPPENLPEPYISQENYRRKHGQDISVSLTTMTENGETGEEPVSVILPAQVDSQKVMEVLAQDLGG